MFQSVTGLCLLVRCVEQVLRMPS